MSKTYLDIMKEHYPSVELKTLYDDFCINEFMASADTKCNDNCAECWATAAHEGAEAEFVKDVLAIPEEWSNPLPNGKIEENPLPESSVDTSVEASAVQTENEENEIKLAPDTAEKLNDKGVAVLKLSVRSHNAILRAGCRTIGDIISSADKLKNSVPKAYEEAAQALQSMGVHLPDVVEGIITYIEVGKIDPHPHNPRKDVGDVTELAESIKANGIMQNLTVVPWFSSLTGKPAEFGEMDGYYRALIGHRRLAAAKKAGLEKVPCVIARNLTMNEQVAIMLAENMQRSDLSVVEQAEGIQMMLDLGDTVDTVAEKTGLSQSTVRRRVKLMDYDAESVKESFERGGTLEDYEKLEKIKDPEKRKELVKKIGTNNFNWEISGAIDAQARYEAVANQKAFLEEFAEPIEKVDFSVMAHSKNYWKDTPLEKPDDFDESKKYYFTQDNYGSSLYIEKTETPKNEAETKAEAERKAAEEECNKRRNGLIALIRQMEERRLEFLREFTAFPCKKVTDILDTVYKISNMLLGNEISRYVEEFVVESIMRIAGVDIHEDVDNEVEYLMNWLDENNISGVKRFVWFAYLKLDTTDTLWDYKCHYNKTYRYDYTQLYDFLQLCGYELSDEEQAIIDGTHELYVKEQTDA